MTANKKPRAAKKPRAKKAPPAAPCQLAKTIGANVRRLRTKAELTQAELGALLVDESGKPSVTPVNARAAVSFLECSGVSTTRKIEQLMRALDCRMSDLIRKV